jgi:AraC family transcriptional regulator, transcriptional activator FtrA
MGQAHKTRVVVLAYDGVDELDLFGAYVPLSKAQAYCQLAVTIASERSFIHGSNGVRFQAHAGLEAIADAAAVVVPGGRGVLEAARSIRYVDAIRSAAACGAAFYTVCSGAFLLAAAGLTQGRTVAVHAAKRTELIHAGKSRSSRSRMVRDGEICSVGGRRNRGVKGVDIALQIIHDVAPEVLRDVTDRLEVKPAPAPAIVSHGKRS